MKRALTVITLVLFTSIAAADVSITDNGKKLTIDCKKDPNVTVVGNSSVVTLTGACTAVTVAGNSNKVTVASTAAATVSGNDNAVTITAVDALTVSGSRNMVSYKTAVAKGGSVAATNTGKDNKVTAGK
jgi:hypothetical protein